MIKPILVIGYGNPSRGDDALGPMLLDFIGQHADQSRVEQLTDFQLQIEYALDLLDRELVLFIDASVSCTEALDFTELEPVKDNSYTSHAMSPSAVLQVYQTVTGQAPPPAFLLSIQGLDFELGSGLSEQASVNLRQASRFVERLLDEPSVEAWRRQVEDHQAVAC